MSDWLIPARLDEDEETARFREAMNRHAEAALNTLDGTVRLRTASSAVTRTRHLARTKLQEALLYAMQARDLDRIDREEALKSAADRGAKAS